jgi:DNA repair photolyase
VVNHPNCERQDHRLFRVRRENPQTEENEMTQRNSITDYWTRPATIERNNFQHKSLSCWALNIAVGCTHGCRFCYVPEVSTRRMGERRNGTPGPLNKLGVEDPDAQWGEYVFLRTWDENAFLQSLRKAESLPVSELNADGNRAVMLCTTTDPYMVIKNADAAKQKELNEARARMVRRALELIRDHSTLNVRILTRGPLAVRDFDIMKSLGNRLLFGMSLPTLRDDLARIYEPSAPGPAARLRTLELAKEAGIPLYVAMAPTFPESDESDFHATLKAIGELEPVTLFHEPINIRAENVERIAAHARELGVEFRSDVFATDKHWRQYAIKQLMMAEILPCFHGMDGRVHLWPDAMLQNHVGKEWLARWWNRISEWPGKEGK